MTTSGKLSFGFSKVKDPKKLTGSIIKEDDQTKEQSTDFVKSLEGKSIISDSSKKDPDAEKPLVIPLIKTNKWRLPNPEDFDKTDESDEKTGRPEIAIAKTGDSITDAAVLELVNQAREDEEKRQSGNQDTHTIPLLLQNAVPDGYETDDRLNVNLRPDPGKEADYDAVPIEQYGMALLRGMGFKEGQGIGKNHKDVKPIEVIVRPKGMGLGADRSLLLQKNDKNASNGAKEGEEEIIMKPGAHCIVISGKHQDLYGKISGLDEDNCRVMVRLALGGETITLNQLAIKLVKPREYEKYSKILNKTKVDKYKEEEENKKLKSSRRDAKDSGSEASHKDKHRKRNEDNNEYSRDSKRHKYRDSERKYKDREDSESERERHSKHKHSSKRSDRGDSEDLEDKHRKRKDDSRDSRKQISRDDSGSEHERHSKHKHSSKRSNGESSSKSRHGESRSVEKSRRTWLQNHLRVRVVDPEYKKGKYYKTKVVVEDVISVDTCVCRTEEDRLLEGLRDSQLETVIPKTDGSVVMVVTGKHRNKIGELLGRDKSQCMATIQVLPDKDEILQLDFDVICEYVGNLHH